MIKSPGQMASASKLHCSSQVQGAWVWMPLEWGSLPSEVLISSQNMQMLTVPCSDSESLFPAGEM